MTLSGARFGRPTWYRKIVARAIARDLSVFVVPGREIANALRLDLEAAGLRPVANPRHADILLLAGVIPAGLQRAAATVYTQMPRPRAILAVGSAAADGLPTPDISVASTQADLATGISEVRRLFETDAWTTEADAFREQHEMHSAGQDMPAVEHMHMHMDGGFMSMVMMTRHLPRSADGLPMEWLEVPFGPLFAGLPGGLALVLTLDGDTVVRAEVEPGILRRELEAGWRGAVDGFAARFAELDPLSKVAYRVLAERAIEAAAGGPVDQLTERHRMAALERERAFSHLQWLANFSLTLGDRWLEQAASNLVRDLRNARDNSALRHLHNEARKLTRASYSAPLLVRRLHGCGVLSNISPEDLDGPVARAAGLATDARAADPTYLGLGFRPVTIQGSDALARLRVRLMEVEQSLELIQALEASGSAPRSEASTRGSGTATVETARGAAILHVEIDEGRVVQVELTTPSQRLSNLVAAVADDRELSDALLGIASLDVSPWEVDR